MGSNADSRPPILVHLCTVPQWEAAQRTGELRPDSLRDVGFVHLSSPEQVHLPANRLYKGRTDLLMLRVDTARLVSPVRWESGVPSDPDGMVFPHLYGPLPTASVMSANAYVPNRHGVFAPISA